MKERKEGKEIYDKEGVAFLLFDPKYETVILEQRSKSDSVYSGLTVVPGETMEIGETQEDTLLRGISEEFGNDIKIEGGTYLCDFMTVGNNNTRNMLHAYLIIYTGKVTNNEGQSIMHCDIKDAEKMLPLGTSKYIIVKALEYLRQNG